MFMGRLGRLLRVPLKSDETMSGGDCFDNLEILGQRRRQMQLKTHGTEYALLGDREWSIELED